VARVDGYIDATPEEVFDVLANAASYGHWVVGSKDIRAADPEWPSPGAKFHHTVGFGPFTVSDHTTCEYAERPHFLQIRAKARPLGTARVKLHLHPEGGGTRVTMIEDAADPLTAFVFNPLTHMLVRGRNKRSLARLRDLAEGRVPMPEPPPSTATSAPAAAS
jgi:uncharacterized protein YndB with AHSA1/START domain